MTPIRILAALDADIALHHTVAARSDAETARVLRIRAQALTEFRERLLREMATKTEAA